MDINEKVCNETEKVVKGEEKRITSPERRTKSPREGIPTTEGVQGSIEAVPVVASTVEAEVEADLDNHPFF